MLDFFNQANAEYIEGLYEEYRKDAESIDPRWAGFFAGLEAAGHSPIGLTSNQGESQAQFRFAEGVNDLVNRYRDLGHFSADLNPLSEKKPDLHPLLTLKELGFTESDLEKPVVSGGFLGTPPDGSLKGLIESLETTYCSTFGLEFRGIPVKEQREWLQEQVEANLNRPALSKEEKISVFTQLTRAESFEQFIHKKYLGAKRFSIEGGESLIPLLNSVIDQAGELEVEEFILGMAHRGRLNVLAHVIDKPYEIIFSEFEGTARTDSNTGDGDVKYHLGYSSNRPTSNGTSIHRSLGANPSHLEFVNPVVEGRVRAKQEYLNDQERLKVVPLLVHGESAFTGQGIVPETLTLTQLRGYSTGGTLHVIVNNQVGFTARPEEVRPTPYPTDIAKAILCPIFHVNGHDPEAVVHAARLAMEFRHRFKSDVMLDLWCFRKYGHNESDDPTFTQPLMYKKISETPSVNQSYRKKLIEEGTLTEEAAKEIEASILEELNAALNRAREERPSHGISKFEGRWSNIKSAGQEWGVPTQIDKSILDQITESITKVPDTFTVHKRIKKNLAQRLEMASGDRPVDWAVAEAWAFGSTLLDGNHVRLTGQDSERGTFSHRHAVWHDANTGEKYTPLSNLADNQARFTVINTMLSELAVLGFEFGYSLANPNNLVIWEAQFGDFVNGAQPILDLFLASSEAKWQRMSGLVLLLPHGFEGQGPEHSSARLERFLQLCADENMQVAYPTKPAQYFHLLRQQILRNFRKPLVLMMPKSLLRYPKSTSTIEDFTQGQFSSVIEYHVEHPEQQERILFCSGKVSYTLLEAIEKDETLKRPILVLEQLYPFPEKEIKAFIDKFPKAKEFVWVQEEPKNMGAWSFTEPRIRNLLPQNMNLHYQGREESASPATGWHWLHLQEEARFTQGALTGTVSTETKKIG